MNQDRFPLLVGLLQPSDGLVLLSGMRVQPRDPHARHVALPRAPGENLGPVVHRPPVPAFRLPAPQRIFHIVVVQGRVKQVRLRQGLLVHPLLVERAPQSHMR